MIIVGKIYNTHLCSECRENIKFKEEAIVQISYFPTEDKYWHLACNPFPEINLERENMNHLERIIDIESQLLEAQRSYLTNHGWHNTSSTPDFIWRWQKKIGDVTYCVDEKAAISIQRNIRSEDPDHE